MQEHMVPLSFLPCTLSKSLLREVYIVQDLHSYTHKSTSIDATRYKKSQR
jgi:hypothetical protein